MIFAAPLFLEGALILLTGVLLGCWFFRWKQQKLHLTREAQETSLREDAQRSAEILARIPARRWGQPAEIGGAVVFLCSSAADYVNGHVLVVDGGWMAR